MALSLEGLLYNDEWQVIAQRPVQDDTAMPAYKIVVGAPDNHVVEDYTGTRRRPATPSEANHFPSERSSHRLAWS